jgi:hypothetical protein
MAQVGEAIAEYETNKKTRSQTERGLCVSGLAFGSPRLASFSATTSARSGMMTGARRSGRAFPRQSTNLKFQMSCVTITNAIAAAPVQAGARSRKVQSSGALATLRSSSAAARGPAAIDVQDLTATPVFRP